MPVIPAAAFAGSPSPIPPDGNHAAVPATAATATTSAPAVPTTSTPPTPADRVVRFATDRLGRPYRYGADGPQAYDCSGLTRQAFATVGIDLPHKSAWQATHGRPVRWSHEPVRPGDLVFVRGGRPTHDRGHVGVAVSATEWVAASPAGGVVRQRIPLARVQAVRRLLEA